MSEELSFEDVSLTDQVILLGVAELARKDETPVQTHDLRQYCRKRLPATDTEVVGTITEADVIRSLYRLEDADLVEEVDPTETSPTGKGRPAYTLGVSIDAVSDGVDERLEGGSD